MKSKLNKDYANGLLIISSSSPQSKIPIQDHPKTQEYQQPKIVINPIYEETKLEIPFEYEQPPELDKVPYGVKKNSVGFAGQHGTDLTVSGGTEKIITTTTNKF